VPAILGKKLGMTQIFTDGGESVPVTVIEAEIRTPVTTITGSFHRPFHLA